MTTRLRHRLAFMVGAAVPLLFFGTVAASADEEMEPYPGCPECGGPPLVVFPAPAAPPEGDPWLDPLIPEHPVDDIMNQCLPEGVIIGDFTDLYVRCPPGMEWPQPH